MGTHVQIVAFGCTWNLFVMAKDNQAACDKIHEAVKSLGGSKLLTKSPYDMKNYPFYATVSVNNTA
ncbi:MAG: hypothetical protein KGJ06_04525, partial [Pseudomonadota bacterium]|nr:hypothetical protein [Pseudomonadota bacterium]